MLSGVMLTAHCATPQANEELRLAQCGSSTEDGRVTGNGRAVAVTRSFGDAAIKRAPTSGLVATPEVRAHARAALCTALGRARRRPPRRPAPYAVRVPWPMLWQVSSTPVSAADEVLILGSDGLWDTLGPNDAWAVAKRVGKRGGKWDYEQAAKALVQEALDRDTRDNIACIVIGLKPPRGGGAGAAGARAAAAGAAKAGAAGAGFVGRVGTAGGSRPATRPPAQHLSIAIGANGQLHSVKLHQTADGQLDWDKMPAAKLPHRPAPRLRPP
jgi:hypothetical protein